MIMNPIAGFWKDERGVSAIEFAYILPIMALLVFGGISVTNALEANRKMSLAASTVADLVAQTKSLTDAQRDDVFNAAQTIMAPFNAANMTVVVSSLTYNNGSAVVAWSDGLRKTGRAVGQVVNVPTGVVTTGTSVIMAEVTFKFDNALGGVKVVAPWSTTYNMLGTVNMTDTYYDRPRQSVAVGRSAN